MGNVGPCGPCTEIHYDKIGNRNAKDLVNKDDPTVIEIWNLVFIQFRRDENGTIIQLNKKHIDTGMGIERIVSILQNCTNYEIDIFSNIINIIKIVTNGPQYTNKYGKDDTNYIDMAYRVIADHVRTMIFAINAGVIPSSTEKGYVIRRIIRRAIRYGTKLNQVKIGFLTDVVDKIINIFIYEYPELEINKYKIVEIISNEEIKFNKVLKKGLQYFTKLIKNENISIKKIFELYTSYGFPIDIIKQLCEENDINFDNNEYNKLMDEHIKISKRRKKN